MKNKGFTLVELLGVIVILSILTAFAFPKILNIIKNSEEEIDDITYKLIYNAVDLYISENSDNIIKLNNATYCVSLDELVANNYLKAPITTTNNEDITNIKSVKITYNNKYNYEIVNNSFCQVDIPYFTNGTKVYFDVENGIECTEEKYNESLVYSTYESNLLATNSVDGYNGVTNKIQNQNSCLRFYAFNDSINNIKISLLLDHLMIENELSDNIFSYTLESFHWNNSISNIRNISKEEIEKLKIDNEVPSWVYFHQGQSTLNNGYWITTDEQLSSNYTYFINNSGNIDKTQEYSSSTIVSGDVPRYGIRPVIEVNKNLLSNQLNSH